MSVNSWEPSASPAEFHIDKALLQDFIRLSREDKLQQLPTCLSDEVRTRQSPLMTLPQDAWTTAAADFGDEELVHLVRFFTIAEQLLEGWEAAEKSPVIWLVKVLRQRQSPPDRNLLLWIKANSDNRFLPNGAL